MTHGTKVLSTNNENENKVKFGFAVGVNENNELFALPLGNEKPDILQLFGLVEYFRFRVNNLVKPVNEEGKEEE